MYRGMGRFAQVMLLGDVASLVQPAFGCTGVCVHGSLGGGRLLRGLRCLLHDVSVFRLGRCSGLQRWRGGRRLRLGLRCLHHGDGVSRLGRYSGLQRCRGSGLRR